MFNGPLNIEAGVPFDLEVRIGNDSGQVLENTHLTISLPEGVAFANRPTDERMYKKSIGHMGVGSLTSEVVSLIVLAPQEDGYRVRTMVDYTPESVGSSFKQVATWDIVVHQSAIRLTAQAPLKVATGEEYALVISYENVGPQDIRMVSIDVEYPPVFKYSDATIEPTEEKTHWDVGDMKKGSSNSFTITGQLIGSEKGSFTSVVTLSTRINGESHVLARETVTTVVDVAPLVLTVLAQGTSDHIARSGEEIRYTIEYQYLDSDSLGSNRATIRAKLNGAMFDVGSLVIGPPDGVLDARDASLVWQLKDLPPRGLVQFSIKTKEEYPIRRLSDRNVVVSVEATMEDGQYASVSRNETKIAGKAVVEVQVFFRDAEGGVVNKGPFPPLVNQDTEYSVHWKIKNYTTDVRNATVRATIPSHVTFVSSHTTTSGKVSYDDTSNEIVWNIDQIPATKGVISNPIEAIFQIKAKPPAHFAQQFLPLLGETRFVATDEFTDLLVESSDVPITSELPDDITARGQGRVLEKQ